jgi:GNAT superfamily N-acetyltransferase
MRVLSRVGVGLNMLSGMNELTHGISLGYVWVIEGRLVGNVSVYPANWPPELGKAWIIANVAVHPDYRGRSIATRLMQASMEMIGKHRGATAILQVDYDNGVARNLYRRLGFADERGWIHWRRPSTSRVPPSSNTVVHITRRRSQEWRAEYEMAQRLRPTITGGMGWLRPLHTGLFKPSLFKKLGDWMSLRSMERLVIRSEDETQLLATLWIESGFATSSPQLTLMVDPEYDGIYDEVLVNTAVRRFGTQPIVIEHPSDEVVTNTILQRYHFTPQRTLVHMRWNAPG